MTGHIFFRASQKDSGSKTTSSDGEELTGPPELGMSPTLATGKSWKVVVTPSSHAPRVSAEAHQRAELGFPSFLRKQSKHSTECNHDRPSSSCLLAPQRALNGNSCIKPASHTRFEGTAAAGDAKDCAQSEASDTLAPCSCRMG